MRSWRTVAVLALLAVVSVALAGWAWRQVRAPLTVAGQGEPLLPALRERLGDVAWLRSRRGGETLLLRRLEDGRWVAGEARWPVQMAQVRSLLLTLTEMRKVRPATARPENYHLIGVGDPAADETATELLLKDASGRVLAHLLLGREAADWLGGGRTAQFVRLAGERQAWLVEGHVRAPVALKDWGDVTLLALPPETLREVVIRHADGEVLRLVARAEAAGQRDVAEAGGSGGKAGETPRLRLADAPPGAVERRDVLLRLQRALAGLTFERVRALPQQGGSEKAAVSGKEPRDIAQVEVRGGDGLQLRLHLLREMEDRKTRWWLRGVVVRAGADEKLARTLQQRFDGRLFEVYDAVATVLAARLQDVIEAQVRDLGDIGTEDAGAGAPAAPRGSSSPVVREVERPAASSSPSSRPSPKTDGE